MYGLEKFTESENTYFKLRVSCPTCDGDGWNTPQSFWSHKNCDGFVFVGDNCKLRCKECNCEKHVHYWKFNCPRHNNCNERSLETVKERNPVQVISTAGQMVSSTGHRWLIKFLTNSGIN